MKTYLREIRKRKDLLFYLVKSGLKAENRDSYLGYFWWLLDPLLNVVVYYLLVGVVLGRGEDTENFPVYLVIGLVAWRWMNTTVNTSSKSIIKYRSIINQVNLPKSIFPLSFTITQLVNFVFGLAVIGIFLLIFGVIPGWQIIYLPIVMLVQLIFLTGIGLMLGYITVFIRDIDNVLSHIIRVFFYASPIIWPGGRLVKSLGSDYQWMIDYNPIAIIVNSYRNIMMYQSNPHFFGLLVVGVVSLLFTVFMLYHYSRNEHKIIKAL